MSLLPKSRIGVVSVLACAALLATFGTTGWLAWLGSGESGGPGGSDWALAKSPTFDEPTHLVSAWIQTHLDDFRCDPENLTLWKIYLALGTQKNAMKLDVASDAWNDMLDGNQADGDYVNKTMFGTPGNDADALVRAGRQRMIFLSILLGILIGWWAWRLAGPVAAVIAVAAFSFDPNFLAHGPLIKNDVPISLIFLALMTSVWLLGERATLWRWAVVALLLGAALTTKFSGILAVPMLGIALLCRTMLPQPWKILGRTAATRWRRLAASVALGIGALAVAFVFIWACYDFRFSPGGNPGVLFNPGPTLQDARRNEAFAAHGGPTAIDTPTLEKWEAQLKPAAAVRAFQWANAGHVLPQGWLMGFLLTWANSRIRATFLLGRRSLLGWWYYFPLAMLFKTPLATLIATLLSAALAWPLLVRPILQSITAKHDPNSQLATPHPPPATRHRPLAPWPFLTLAIAPTLYLASAMTSHLDQGIRYVLPVYPFLFIFIGIIAAQAWKHRPRATAAASTLFILGLMLETFHAFPNFIPFFNVAANHWGDHGAKLLSDSNIDWGQELIDLAQWKHDNPNTQLYLCYFGSDDPRYYGLHYVKMPGGFGPPDQDQPTGKPAIYAISVVAFQAPYLAQYEVDYLQPFRNRPPLKVLGGSIYLYNSPQ